MMDDEYIYDDNEYGDSGHPSYPAATGPWTPSLPSHLHSMTTKIPPGYDGKMSWFTYEDAIDEWEDITELDKEK